MVTEVPLSLFSYSERVYLAGLENSSVKSGRSSRPELV